MGVTAPTGRRPSAWALGSAGISMIGVSYGFARYGYGLFEPEIREAFGISVALSGAIAGGAYVGYVLGLATAGLLARRVGPCPLIAAAGISAGVGMAVVVLADRPWQLLAGLVVAGASSGFAWAPYSDAIDQLVDERRRHGLLAAIPSGTAFGIVVAGGLAMVGTGMSWRGAWTVFCALAVLATAQNLWVLRGTTRAGRADEAGPRVPARTFLRPGSRPLYGTAFSYGVVGAVYWTFSVAVVSPAGPATAMPPAVFWTLIGVAGTVAIAAGRMFGRFGLPRSHSLLLGGLALAAGLVAAAPGWWPVTGLSAIVYGACFMATSGLLAVWSYDLFPDRAAQGFSATVFCLGLGAVVGPALFGALADLVTLRGALLAAAVVAVATLGLRPGVADRSGGAVVAEHPDR